MIEIDDNLLSEKGEVKPGDLFYIDIAEGEFLYRLCKAPVRGGTLFLYNLEQEISLCDPHSYSIEEYDRVCDVTRMINGLGVVNRVISYIPRNAYKLKVEGV